MPFFSENGFIFEWILFIYKTKRDPTAYIKFCGLLEMFKISFLMILVIIAQTIGILSWNENDLFYWEIFFNIFLFILLILEIYAFCRVTQMFNIVIQKVQYHLHGYIFLYIFLHLLWLWSYFALPGLSISVQLKMIHFI